jgi:hypothetical protein
MATEKYIQVLFPTGRLITGSLYNPNTTNMVGEPLMYKSGKKKDQPRVDYFIGIAIKKTPGVTHWSQEVSGNARVGAWGKKIWDAAHLFWGDIAGKKDNFAWKIIDGDSTSYDNGNPPKRPCDKPNYKGHWIINMSRDLPPVITNKDGSKFLLEPDAIRRGYFVQIVATIKSNETPDKMGIFITHDAVSLQFFGEEILSGIDPASVGFGGDNAPIGAHPIPDGAFGHMPASPTVVTAAPNHNFINNAIAPPPLPPAPPTAPLPVSEPRKLTNGMSYDSYIAVGWTDEQLREKGLL